MYQIFHDDANNTTFDYSATHSFQNLKSLLFMHAIFKPPVSIEVFTLKETELIIAHSLEQ